MEATVLNLNLKIWRLDLLGDVLLKSEINRACAFHSVHSCFKIQTTTDELMFVTPAIPSTISCVSLSNVQFMEGSTFLPIVPRCFQKRGQLQMIFIPLYINCNTEASLHMIVLNPHIASLDRLSN